MRTLNQLFTKAKEVRKNNSLQVSYTMCLSFMLLSGSLVGSEVDKVEDYLMSKHFDINTAQGLMEHNDIKI